MYYIIKLPNLFDVSIFVKPLFSVDEILFEGWLHITLDETWVYSISIIRYKLKTSRPAMVSPPRWELGMG